jgi:hypothetical protein
MQNNKKEQNFLGESRKFNFKSQRKNDMVNLESKLEKMNAEVAKEVIAKFPEFTSLQKDVCKESNETICKILESDDKILGNYYEACNKEIDSLNVDCDKEYAFDEKIQKELSEQLENPKLTVEDKMKFIDKKIECHEKSSQTVECIRNQQKEIRKEIDNKDNMKRMFDWKTTLNCTSLGILIGGAAISVLGSDSNINLFKD